MRGSALILTHGSLLPVLNKNCYLYITLSFSLYQYMYHLTFS